MAVPAFLAPGHIVSPQTRLFSKVPLLSRSTRQFTHFSITLLSPSPPASSPPPASPPSTSQLSETKSKTNPIPSLPSPLPRFYDFSSRPVEAFRLTHCRVLSTQLAQFVEKAVRAKTTTLSALATQLSVCLPTRRAGGDTNWITLPSPKSANDVSQPIPVDSPIVSTTVSDVNQVVVNDEWLPHILHARPGALTVAYTPYGCEVFVVTDIRYQLDVTSLRMRPGGGVRASGRMRRHIPRVKAAIDHNTYFIETLGCQMNASDSERMAAVLQSAGYVPTADPKRSSVYVLNTCALREHAQEKVYSYLGPHAHRKWEFPQDVTLVVAGCVAQQEGEALLYSVPEVDVVVGPQYANRLDEILLQFKERATQIVATDPTHIHEDLSKPVRESRVTAWINVIYGCLERCTYCVVPNTRGLEQSREMSAIRDEVVAAVCDGYKEVVLLGQNVDAYGRDLFPKRTFGDLLRYIHDVDGLERIRFTTGHPRYISDGLIATVAELPKIMEHFHIPPQSGDTKVLRDMRRGYSRERYLEIARRIRKRIPDASICADMIVGFPGESDEAFQNSVTLADEVVFDANMVRAYSARPNTDAALRDDQVSETKKKERLDILNAKMKEHALQRSRRFLGREVEVLVEGPNRRVSGEMMGRERSNRVVFFRGGSELVGCIVYVIIEEAYTFSLRGHLTRCKEPVRSKGGSNEEYMCT